MEKSTVVGHRKGSGICGPPSVFGRCFFGWCVVHGGWWCVCVCVLVVVAWGSWVWWVIFLQLPTSKSLVPLLSLLRRLTCGTLSTHQTHYPHTLTHCRAQHCTPPINAPTKKWTTTHPWPLPMPFNCAPFNGFSNFLYASPAAVGFLICQILFWMESWIFGLTWTYFNFR